MYFNDLTTEYDNILRVAHLCLDPDSGEASLLNYPLKLSKLEFKLLKALVLAYPDSLSVERLCKDTRISRDSLAVHICAINKKAALISERRLILFSNGYIINEFM